MTTSLNVLLSNMSIFESFKYSVALLYGQEQKFGIMFEIILANE